MIWKWFGSKEREARQLNKDSRSIVEMTEQTYRAERQTEIARMVRERLSEIDATCGDDPTCRERELDRIKARHREARRSLDQVALTGHTLLIIYLRSLSLDEASRPAIETIDAFVARWSSADDEGEDSVLPG